MLRIRKSLHPNYAPKRRGSTRYSWKLGLNINLEVLKQLDGHSDKWVILDHFHGKLKEVAKPEVLATGDVAAVTEIKIQWIVGD